MQIRLVKVNDSMTPYLRRLSASLSFDAQRRVTRQMAKRFWQITRANIGTSGVDRPKPWPALSLKYIQALKRKGQGPFIPTLLRSGSLLNSIGLISSGNTAEVYSDSPYARAHQFGYAPRNLPARPYFPAINDELTDYANRQVITAAVQEITDIVRT